MNLENTWTTYCSRPAVRAGVAVFMAAAALCNTARAEYIFPTDDAGYAQVCEDRGVPLPPPWGAYAPEDAPYAWTFSGELAGDGAYNPGGAIHLTWGAIGIRKVYYYKEASGPNAGVCAAFADAPSSNPTHTNPLGVICQSKSGKTCFWETNHESQDVLSFPPPSEIVIADPSFANITKGSDNLPIFTGAGKAAPNNIEEGCTVCHQGANAFISHGSTYPPFSYVDPTDLRDVVGEQFWFPQRWPDAIVPSGQQRWPQMLGPDTLAGVPSGTCTGCHTSTGTGRQLPLLVSNYTLANYPDGAFASDVLKKSTSNISSASEPTAIDAMPPFVGGSSTTPMVEEMLARLGVTGFSEYTPPPTTDNVAFAKWSRMSNGYSGALANDGWNDGSQFVSSGLETSAFNAGAEGTLGGGPYWQIDLDGEYDVRLLRIYSRSLKNFRILYWNGETWSEGSDQSGVTRTQQEEDGNVPYVINVDFRTDMVILQKLDNQDPLELTEVEIYADEAGLPLGEHCSSAGDCASNDCRWSPVQYSYVCAEWNYEPFSETSRIASFDEVTKLPYSGGGGELAWQVTGGRLYEPSNAGGSPTSSLLIHSDKVIADGWVEATMYSADNDCQGVVFRYQDPDHYYSLEVTEAGWNLRRWDGNDTYTDLASYSLSGFDWSTPHTLRIEGKGEILEARLDGNYLASVVDYAYTSGRVGLMERFQSGAYFDDFNAVDTTEPADYRTFQVRADRDVLLRGGSYAANNYGSLTNWYVSGPSSLSNARKMGVSFDVSRLAGATVTEASLNIIDYVASNAPADKAIHVYGVHESEGDYWAESGVSWNTFPGNNPSSPTQADPSKATDLGLVTVEYGQDNGNHGLALRGPALVDFLNEDTDGRVTFLLTSASGYHLGNVALRERSGDCKLQNTAAAGDCAATLDITAE